MTTLTQRHDISDHLWALLEPHLPGQAGQWGGIAHDNRRFINGVLWILRTGAPWRDLPEVYGDWKNTHRRFCRWRDKGLWESLLDRFIDDPDYEWLMIEPIFLRYPVGTVLAKAGQRSFVEWFFLFSAMMFAMI